MSFLATYFDGSPALTCRGLPLRLAAWRGAPRGGLLERGDCGVARLLCGLNALLRGGEVLFQLGA
jgi:hypothetical protein